MQIAAAARHIGGYGVDGELTNLRSARSIQIGHLLAAVRPREGGELFSNSFDIDAQSHTNSSLRSIRLSILTSLSMQTFACLARLAKANQSRNNTPTRTLPRPLRTRGRGSARFPLHYERRSLLVHLSQLRIFWSQLVAKHYDLRFVPPKHPPSRACVIHTQGRTVGRYLAGRQPDMQRVVGNEQR